MPLLTSPISGDGPVVSVLIGPSGPRQPALRAAGQPVPNPVLGRALIDTGASCTAIDASIAHAIGLVPTGSTSILTPSTGTVPHICRQYDISLTLLMQPPQFHVASLVIPVIEAPLANQGIQALIGRDELAGGLFIYNGQAGTMSLAF